MAIVQKTRMIIRYGNRADLRQLATGEFGYALDTGEIFIGAPNLTSQNSGNLKIVTETSSDYRYTLLQGTTTSSDKNYVSIVPLYTLTNSTIDTLTTPTDGSGPNIPSIIDIEYKLFFGDKIIETGNTKLVSTSYISQNSNQYIDSDTYEALVSATVPTDFTQNVETVTTNGVYTYDTTNNFDTTKLFPASKLKIANSTDNVYYVSSQSDDIEVSKSSNFVQFLVSYSQTTQTNTDSSTQENTNIAVYAFCNASNSTTNTLKLYYKIKGSFN